MPLQHHFRVTKYDPALRDAAGSYTGDDWTMFEQIGKSFGGTPLTLPTYLDVEARHLITLASFLEATGTQRVIADHVENAGGSFRVVEGQALSRVEAIEAVRQMLREEGWCRLIDGDRFYIHVGRDYYVYVGTEADCPDSVALAVKNGLFVDRDFASPYLVLPDEER
jgi:hypothetical protein